MKGKLYELLDETYAFRSGKSVKEILDKAKRDWYNGRYDSGEWFQHYFGEILVEEEASK